MKAWGIILAGGKGERLGFQKPKGLVDVAGKSLIEKAFDAFAEADRCDAYVCVMPDWQERYPLRTQQDGDLAPPSPPGQIQLPRRLPVFWVPAGRSRQESVRNAIAAIEEFDAPDVVVIHDAARPLVTPELIERALAGLEHADGAICAVPVSDTLKRVSGDVVDATVAREGLWRAQTPQAFRLDVLREAHERAARDGIDATDDAQLVEHYGGKVIVVPGDERNIKITTRADLVMAELLLNEPQGRPGVGYDAHRLVEGRPLVIGGVTLPSPRGLDGHSDADVLLHAITNALLGSVAKGDMGTYFPSSDPRWKDVSSAVFVRDAVRIVNDAGFEVSFVDSMVVLQEPPIAPHRRAIRESIASLLGLPLAHVSVKATTTDRIGKIGASEAAAAFVVARVEPRGT